METVLILGAIVAVIALAITINKQQDKKQKKLLQQRLNLEIERYVLDTPISKLVLHSNHEFLAHLIAKRIQEVMFLGASPVKILQLLDKLGIKHKIDYPKSNAEDQLKYKIQKSLYETIDDLDARRWMQASVANTQEDWNGLKGTILTSFKHNGFYFNFNFF